MKLLAEIIERINQAIGGNSLLASIKHIARTLKLAYAKLEKMAVVGRASCYLFFYLLICNIILIT